jgi:hypothetical protein
MRKAQITDAGSSVTPAVSTRKRLAGFLAAVLVGLSTGLCSYFLVNVRKTRLEAGMVPPIYEGRPAGMLVGWRPKDPLPTYRLTLTNVSQGTLFRCRPTVADGEGNEMGYESIDIQASEHHQWFVPMQRTANGEQFEKLYIRACVHLLRCFWV